jgi:hypothetical protein
VSVQNVSCGTAHHLLNRFAKTDTGLRCLMISEGSHAPAMRCTARLRFAGHRGASPRYVTAVIRIAGLPECVDGDGCGI